MPPKRRQQQPADDSASEDEIAAPSQRRQRRRATSSDPDSDSSTSDPPPTQTQSQSINSEMVKKLVRLALACEFSRTPIRRQEISNRVLGEIGSRKFKAVFEGAQIELRNVFGMEMVELAGKEKGGGAAGRRVTQKSQSQTSTSTKSWAVVSILPSAYKQNPLIIAPTAAPSAAAEATYTALYTFLITLVTLYGGKIAEHKIQRYMSRTNIQDYTPLGSTEKVLARMVKEGYLVKLKDSVGGGEEMIEYVVGPRGKIEVGLGGVEGLVRSVYGVTGREGEDGDGIDLDEEEKEEFERRLKRSLMEVMPVKEQRATNGVRD